MSRRNPNGIRRSDRIEQTPLERWRVEHQLSVQELARRVGITSSTMVCWLRGSVLPRVPAACRIQDITEGEVPVEAWLATKLGRAEYLYLEGRSEKR